MKRPSMKRQRVTAWMVVPMLALALAACANNDDDDPDPDGNPDTATVRLLQPVPGGENLFFYPSFVGDELGYFEDAGIDLEVMSASGNVPIPAFVSNGEAEIGVAGADDTLPGNSQGADNRLVYEYFRLAGKFMAVPEDSDIERVADFEGRTVGLSEEDERTFVSSTLTAVGVDPDSVRFVVIGDGIETAVDALNSGTIDAFAAGASTIAQLSGVLPIREIEAEGVEGRPTASFVASQSYIDENADVLQRFLRAWTMSTYAGLSNPEALEAMARMRLPDAFGNEDVALAVLDLAQRGTQPEDGAEFGDFRVAAWEEALEQLTAEGSIEGDGEQVLDDLFDGEFLEGAIDWDPAEVERDMQEWLEQNG
jgi:NitT/TauT family transport system substrate-binding protein